MTSARLFKGPVRLLTAWIPTLIPSITQAQLINISADTPSSPTTPLPSTPAETPTLTTPTPTPTPTPTLPTSLPPISTSTPATSSLPITSSLPLPSHSLSSLGPSSSPPVQSHTSSVIYLTITATGSDGNIYTSVSATASAVPIQTGLSSSGGGGGSSSGGTWAIIGGVVGGLAALAAVIFIVFRCTQRRFSELDDEDVAIKWPELVNRADDASTLNPLAARQAAGHGIGDDGDDEKPSVSPHQGLYSDHSYAPDLSRGNTVQSAMFSNGSYQAGPGGYGEHQAYCKLTSDHTLSSDQSSITFISVLLNAFRLKQTLQLITRF
ncbi:hypothetical protein DFH28DRAFT_879439 [Melampsora americana]|nr:hypothetical protein DFH28DRAFT_879439 [Melampsora americana]